MRLLKIGGVIFGALVITTLGISASDALRGSSGSLLGQLAGSQNDGCPVGMLTVATGGTFSCMDMYEASPSDNCPLLAVGSLGDTQTNLNETECASVSVLDAQPWTYVSREQAELLCRRGGNRLPTAAEWYHVAVGTPDATAACNISGSSVAKAGQHKNCVSALGGYDFVGNAWEWVNDDVFDGRYNDRSLPPDGYVTQVASDGVATVSDSSVPTDFSDDYIWTNDSGAYGILRGGYFGSKSDAGVYAIQAKTVPTAATQAIGFRCVR